MEAPVEPETDETLRVLAPGERSPETIFTLNRELARQIYPRRKALALQDPEALRALITSRLGVPAVRRSTRATAPGSKPALLAIGASEEDLAPYRRKGFVIREFEPPQFPPGRGSYTGAYQAAAREWLYGRTLLGNLVGELAGTLSELRALPEVDPRRISLLGRGKHALTVQLLGALEGPVERVVTFDPPPSWFEFTQRLEHRELAELAVPGVLLDFDVPDLARLLPAGH